MWFLISLLISSCRGNSQSLSQPLRHLDDCPTYCNVDWGYYEVDCNCLPCNIACGSCSGPTSHECIQCSSDYKMIFSICMLNCPLGYTNSGGICDIINADGEVYNLDFTLIKNAIEETVKVSASVMAISAGSTSDYYPTYDTNDPFAVKKRGFYFSGKSYYTNTDQLLVFSPVFTLGMWLKPLVGTCYIFAKQDSSNIWVGVSLSSYLPKLEIRIDGATKSFSSTSALTGSSWNFLMAQVTLSNFLAKITIGVNTNQQSSSVFSNFFSDIVTGAYFTTGAKLTASAYTNFYTGYLWSFTLYNVETSLSSFVQTSGCNSGSICPINNSNDVIPTCSLTQYINDSGVCTSCTSSCQTYGCVRNDIKCNLCLDQKCYNCNSFLQVCSLCIENAYLVNSNSCVCNYNYIWDSTLEKCRPCSSNCENCDGGGYLGCSLCKPGFYMLWGLCVSFCPTGYEISGSECTLIGSSLILDLTLIGTEGVVYDTASDIPVVTGTSSQFYPEYESDDPIATLERGYYFTGDSVMHFAPYSTYTTPYLNFAPAFYIAMWVNPKSPDGIIFSDVCPDSDYNTTAEVSLVSRYPTITLALSESTANSNTTYPSYSCSEKIPLNSWSYVAFAVSLDTHERTYVTCYINNVPDDPHLLGSGHVTDETQNHNMMLGTKQTDISTTDPDYYQGTVYRVIVDVDPETVLDQITTDCEGTCTVCPIDGVCLTDCMSTCLTCTSASNGDCTSCQSGYYLTDGLCVSTCQTGDSISGSTCIDNGGDTEILHYVFDTTMNNPPDLTADLLAFMGSSVNYVGNFDANDPLPVYMRGIYFAGTEKYANLPTNQAETRSVILGNTHTIQVWVRPTESSPGCILVKESNSETYLYVFVDSSLAPSASYKVFDIYTNLGKAFSATGQVLDLNVWQLLVVVFERIGEDCSINLYVDGIAGTPSQSPMSYFSEPSTLLFKLGYSSTYSTSFQGYIYELIIYNYAITPVVPSACSCGPCTESGDCLSTCDYLEYLDTDGSCLACLPECTDGCVVGTTCSNNKDPLCEEYDGYEISDCTSCVYLAEFTDSGCACIANTIDLLTSCTCIDNYEVYNDQCAPCYYIIQTIDIDGYFSQDYLALEFDFAYSLQSSISSNCNTLFYADSVELFGIDPVCMWNNEFNKLTVTLGTNATVYLDTVTFKDNTLLTNVVTCGSNRGPVDTDIYFKYSLPVVIPKAVLDAPFAYFIFCGNLKLDGYRSSGGYGRALKYQWEFTSSPVLDVLMQSPDLDQANIKYINSTLSPTIANASLTVTNWLGYNNTEWQTVEINDGVGLDLVLDKNIKWKLTSENSKTIYVQAQSECKISNSLVYTWTVESFTGTDAFVNTQLLWGSQKTPSKLHIPAGALGPGVYVFLLVVTDTELNLSGKTKLSITISYSNLEINFNPQYLTIPVSNSYTLDGSVAVDPDSTNSAMYYQWTCHYIGGNCTSVISDPFAMSPTFSPASVDLDKVYNFTLSITKDVRTLQKILSLLVSSNAGVSAKFSEIPLYVNNQENFVIRLDLEEQCNCTYFWTLIYGPGLEMSTDVSSKDLGILPYSMQPGYLYVVEVLVTDPNGKESVFRKYFTVDISPIGGSFFPTLHSGYELNTVFKLVANDWYDPKDPSSALTYQFGYYLNGITYFVNMRNETSYFYTTLPIGEVTVFARIYDAYGSYVEGTDHVSVRSLNLKISDLISAVDFLLGLSWTDPDIFPGKLSNLALYIDANSVDPVEILAAFDTSNECIDVLRESLNEADFGKIDVLLQMVNASTIYDVDKGNKSALFQQLGSITQVISDFSVIMSLPRAQSYVEVISNISPFNYTTVMEDTFDLSQANEVLKDLCLASTLTMGQSQSLQFGSSSIQSYFKLFQGDQVWNYSTTEIFNTSYISLPLTSQLEFNSSLTILIIFISYNTFSDLYNTTSEYSSAIEFSLYQISASTQTYIYLNFTTETINLTIPVWNLEKDNPRCGYLDFYDWSNAGCKLLEVNENGNLCGCTHTSLFSSGSHLGEGDSGGIDHIPIIIFIVCLLAFLWMLLACCLMCKDRKEAESKIFVDKILAGLPVIGKKQQGFRENVIADQLGRDFDKKERSENKKDSEYVPTAKIGVIGAYFDEKQNLESSEKDEFQMSGPHNYHGDSQKFKIGGMLGDNPFRNSGYEEVKETDFDGENEKVTYYPSRQSDFENKGSNFEILPHVELTKENRASLPRLDGVNPLNLDVEGKGKAVPNPYQSGPRLSGISPLKMNEKDLESKSNKASNPYQSGPRLSGISPLEMKEKEADFKSGKVSNPYQSGPRLLGTSPLDLADGKNEPKDLSSSNPYQSGPRLSGLSPLNLNQEIDSKDPSSSKPYQSGPRLSGISPLDLESQKLEGKNSKSPGSYKPGPGLAGVSPMEIDPESEDQICKNSEKFDYEGRREGLKLTEIPSMEPHSRHADSQKPTIKSSQIGPDGQYIDPYQSPSVIGSYFEHRNPSQIRKFQDPVVIEDLSDKKEPNEKDVLIGSAEMAGGEPKPILTVKRSLPKPLEEEKFEMTELFTQPDSTTNRFRKQKHAEQEVMHIDDEQPRPYPGWIADYFFSAILFYHSNYSRFSRCAQGVCSFFLQTIFIGIIISQMGNAYADDKGGSLETIIKNLVFQDVAISFCMVILANALMGMLLCCFFNMKTVNQFLTETERNAILRKNIVMSRIGTGVVILIIIGTVIGVALIEREMTAAGSLLWVACLFIAFLFDFFLIQILKVLIFTYSFTGLILP